MIQTITKALYILLSIVTLGVLNANSQINTDQVMRVGQNAMYFEDYVLSIQYFNQAIQSKPYLAQPYLLRAIAKINLEDYAGAEADATTAIDLNPFLADAWEVRGVARQNMGKNQLAIQDYDEALKSLMNNRQIMFNRAMAFGALKDYATADSAFTELIRLYPKFDRAYTARALSRIESTDTVSAKADLDRAIELNPNAFNAYVLRAQMLETHDKDHAAAIQDMNQAIKLEPKQESLYINRAYLRYNNDDYFGAMADYSYALELDPGNKAALYNRALLRTEVSDLDNALTDYNQILSIDPENDLALYNRAVIYAEKGQYKDAIADMTRLIDMYPTLGAPYFMRSDWYRETGNMARAKADYETAERLVDANRPITREVRHKNAFVMSEDDIDTNTEELTQEQFAQRFNQLLTVDNNTDFEEEYNNQSIRGKVQDRNLTIEIEPMMELTFYSSPNELRRKDYYVKEIDDINNTRILRNPIMVTNKPMSIDADHIKQHFASIDYYTSYLATHTPRTIDYLARALDFITVRNYPAAIADLDKAIAMSPDHPIAYMLRAQTRSHISDDNSSIARNNLIRADLDRVIELSPRNALAWYNKGNALFEASDLTSAIAAYTRAIELQPDMGEAYYNRGYIYLKSGNQERGVADLSKAGELGIVSAYNLIKRLTK